MAFISSINKIYSDFDNERARLVDERDHPKPNERFIDKKIVDAINEANAKEINKKLGQLAVDSKAKITEALNTYLDSLKGRFTKTADNIDQTDLLLLSGPVHLTAQDIEAMYDKYQRAGNDAMMQVIADYDHEHGEKAQITFYTQEAREAAARDYAIAAAQALDNPDSMQHAMIIDGRMVPPALKNE